MIDNKTIEHDPAAPKSRNARFVPFFIIIAVAIAIGFTIRHFVNSKRDTTRSRTVGGIFQ